MSDETRRRLEAAGSRDVPPMDPEAADRLEARLLAIAATAPSGAPEPARTADEAPLRGSGAGRWLVVAGAAFAAIAIAFALALGTPRPDVAPELAAPVNVEVALANGTTLEDPDGLRLPEGAVITVGEGGSARIGDLELVEGDVATVQGGEVHVVHRPPLGSVPDPTPGIATPEPTPDPTHTPGPRVTPTPREPDATPRPTREPTPRPTREPERTPAPTREPDRTPAPTATPKPPEPTATPRPDPVPPRLRARKLAERPAIAVTWSRTLGTRTYVLLATGSRTGSAADPQYPGDARVLGEFARPPETPLRFRVPDGVVEVRLLVVALRRDGTEIARSRIVTVATAP